MSPDLPAPFRRAVPGDAPELARLKNIAGLGMTLHVWTSLAPGDPWAHGTALLEKAVAAGQPVVAGETGAIRAMLLGYRVPEALPPMETLSPLYHSVVRLRHTAQGSWYLDDLATLPEERGQGLGRRMLALAEEIARGEGLNEVSLAVADINHGARRLYAAAGYAETDSAAFEPHGWETEMRRWILMRKRLG